MFEDSFQKNLGIRLFFEIKRVFFFFVVSVSRSLKAQGDDALLYDEKVSVFVLRLFNSTSRLFCLFVCLCYVLSSGDRCALMLVLNKHTSWV